MVRVLLCDFRAYKALMDLVFTAKRVDRVVFPQPKGDNGLACSDYVRHGKVMVTHFLGMRKPGPVL